MTPLNPRFSRWLLPLAAALMLATRLPLVLLLDVHQWSDLDWYLNRALELVTSGRYAEGGVPTAFWPVGYPAFLAGVMWLTRPDALVGQLANLGLSLLALWMLHSWCLRQFKDARVAGTAALLLALYPNHMGYSVGLYSEPLFTALLLAIFLLVEPDAPRWRRVVAGLIAGAATLVKAQFMLLGPILLFVLACRSINLQGCMPALRQSVLSIFIMAMAIAPWTYRNWTTLGAPVPVSTNGGLSLLAGNNPSMTTSLANDFNDTDPVFKEVGFKVDAQVEGDQRAKAAAWKWIGENPVRFIALMPKKFFRLWALDGESEWLFQAGYAQYEQHKGLFRSIRLVNQAYYALLLLGFLLAWRRWASLKAPAEIAVPIMIAFFSALSMVFSGQSRYHAPLMPFIIGYAAWSIVSLRPHGVRA